MRLFLTAFTAQGAALAQSLIPKLVAQGDVCALALPRRLAAGEEGYQSLAEWTSDAFSKGEGLIFVGACGIAVRAIAPLIRDKFTDPAVVSVDEKGRFAVPLLSGHVGGGNRLAERVAAHCGGVAAVSTATDVNGLFAVDEWAARQGFYLDNRDVAKYISAALLAGEVVGVQSDFPIQGELPRGVRETPAPLGLCITMEENRAPFPETLRLIPRILTLGIGCRRGTGAGAIARGVEQALAVRGLSPLAVRGVATIDLKWDEAGLLDFCAQRQWPLAFYSAQALAQAAGVFTTSPFVERVTGVDNVCERAAVLGGGRLLVQKQAREGVTVAVAADPITVTFEGEGETCE